MQIVLLSTFPEFFTSIFSTSILLRAQQKRVVQISYLNLRDFTLDSHRTTDDRPFGGGAGMVMKIEPVHKALQSLPVLTDGQRQLIVLTSAKGQRFTQRLAHEWSQLDRLVLICGHYQGVDERIAEHLIDLEVRIGDFVLTGGELPAAVMVDAVTRLLPGVLGNQESLLQESHDESHLGAAPVYTRPEIYQNWRVPSVLLGGNPQLIAQWQEQHRSPLPD